MGIQITFPALQSINDGVSLAFNSQLYAAPGIYKAFSFDAPSTGEEEFYPRLDMLKGLREWVGDRVVNSLSISTFAIKNKTFEETIGIRREQVEDDKYGFLTPIAGEMGLNASRLPDLLIAALMLKAHTMPCWDGQNFCDAGHPNFNRDGTATTVTNYADGSGDPWFLIDDSRILRPFIFQSRRAFNVIPKFSMTDPQVFWNNEFIWGVDGRCNAGFGLWQLVFMSKQELTHDNVEAARTAMASLRRPDGAPMGINGKLLVTTTSNFLKAKALEQNDFQPLTATATSLVPNQLKGVVKALENVWLN